MSNAQPSPPKIQQLFLFRKALFFRMYSAISLPLRFASRAAMNSCVASWLAAPSSKVSRYFFAAATFTSSLPLATMYSIFSFRSLRIFFWPRYIPRPCSALSSNREFAHAGPLPSLLTVYGLVAAGPPQMDEQPVALEIIM